MLMFIMLFPGLTFLVARGPTFVLPSCPVKMKSNVKQPTTVKLSLGALRQIKVAAKKLDMTLSAFIAEAAELRAAEVKKQCPTCHRAH